MRNSESMVNAFSSNSMIPLGAATPKPPANNGVTML